MLFMTSHKVRQPIANILGITNMLTNTKLTAKELTRLLGYMKVSAFTLDTFTQELTAFMDEQRLKNAL